MLYPGPPTAALRNAKTGVMLFYPLCIFLLATEPVFLWMVGGCWFRVSVTREHKETSAPESDRLQLSKRRAK